MKNNLLGRCRKGSFEIKSSAKNNKFLKTPVRYLPC